MTPPLRNYARGRADASPLDAAWAEVERAAEEGWHPSPLTRVQRWRLWLELRIRDIGKRIGPFPHEPNRPCECGDTHPHLDWPR